MGRGIQEEFTQKSALGAGGRGWVKVGFSQAVQALTSLRPPFNLALDTVQQRCSANGPGSTPRHVRFYSRMIPVSLGNRSHSTETGLQSEEPCKYTATLTAPGVSAELVLKLLRSLSCCLSTYSALLGVERASPWWVPQE